MEQTKSYYARTLEVSRTGVSQALYWKCCMQPQQNNLVHRSLSVTPWRHSDRRSGQGAFDSDMFWLDRNTVPTMGDYFRAAGYQTYYKGKWHISDEDIIIPGTHKALPSYHPLTGYPTEDWKAYMSKPTAWIALDFPGGSVQSRMGETHEIPVPPPLLV